jgi:IKI3 family
MTNFKEGVTPPPMCSYSLKLPSSASSVVFAPFNETSNDLCVVTCENEIAIFTQNCKTVILIITLQITISDNLLAPTKPFDKISILDPDDGLGFQSSGTKLFPADFCALDFHDFESLKFRALPLSLHHWLMVSRNTLVCVMPGEKSSSFLLTVEFENGSAVVK